jgi:secreted trypsin-like serine protease
MASVRDQDVDWQGYHQFQYSFIPITGPYEQQKKPIANTVVLINQGNTVVIVDNMLRILPNQSFTFQGFPGEICIHNFSVSFVNPFGPGANNLCIMVTKNYAK